MKKYDRMTAFLAFCSLVYGAVSQSSAYPSQTVASSQSLSANPAESTLFHHRANQASFVLSDYLYIDGGDITMWSGEGSGFQYEFRQADGDIITLPNNVTLSIDLTKSWTSDSVTLNPIDKGEAPIMSGENLWMGPEGNTFYAYNGALTADITFSDDLAVPPNQLWEFEPSGALGTWSQVDIPPSNFSTLIRTDSAAYGSGNSLGFALGGWQWFATTEALDPAGDVAAIGGMVVYNLTSQQWYNVSSASSNGAFSKGAAHFAPIYGPEGILFVFGGYQGQEFASFDWVLMYEPVSQQWQYQRATGDLPVRVAYPCVVGLPGDNGTYEIFLYGGIALHGKTGTIESAGAVYALSLPSFRWYKQDSVPEFGRFFHSCSIIGQRQMAVVGGMTEYIDTPHYADDEYGPGQEVDPWGPSGIGIFDLSAFEWTNSYDANADPYVTHQTIKAYAADNPKPNEWANDVVASWFANERPPTPTPTPSQSPTPSPSSPGAGTIAGAVVGGVVGIAAIAVGIWWCITRRRRNRHARWSEPMPEPYHYPMTSEKREAVEVASPPWSPSSPQRPQSELYGTEQHRSVHQARQAELP